MLSPASSLRHLRIPHDRRRTHRTRHGSPPRGPRQRARRPGDSANDRVHGPVSRLDSPLRLGRHLVPPWLVARRAQHDHADGSGGSAPGRRTRHARPRGPADRPVSLPDPGDPAASRRLRGPTCGQSGVRHRRRRAGECYVVRTVVHLVASRYRSGTCGEEGWFRVAEIMSLAKAIAAAVNDGDTVAMEGFTHLIPHAAGHEVIRQRRQDLTLVRMTPDIIYDQLIGAGCASKLVFSWAGNPGVGSLHRFRDAVEHAWPVPLEIEEHSHAGMANRYVAGASGLPFAILRGYRGTSLPAETTGVAEIVCPFTGERLTAVSALRPDVAVIHAQRADRQGNVQYWGITGVQKECVLAAARSVITVEEIVDVLDPQPGAVVLPSWLVSYVAVVPDGAHPSYALGYSARDNDFYLAWDAISRDRVRFGSWLDEHVRGCGAVLAGTAEDPVDA